MKRILSFIVFFSIGLLALSFALLNVEEVKIGYYLGSVQAPLSLILVITLAIGAFLGMAASIWLVVGLKRDISRLQKTVKVAEKEVTNLRTLPIKDEH